MSSYTRWNAIDASEGETKPRASGSVSLGSITPQFWTLSEEMVGADL
jgi:hypothetical protein